MNKWAEVHTLHATYKSQLVIADFRQFQYYHNSKALLQNVEGHVLN